MVVIRKMRQLYKYNVDEAGYSYSYIAPFVINVLNKYNNLRIMELGCGNGYFCNALAEKGHKVLGVDISESGIQIGRTSFPKVQFINSDIYGLLDDGQIDPESFDVIIAIEVIEHLQYPKDLIGIARKYLRNGGLLIIPTPYHGYLKNVAISLFNMWDKHFNVFWEMGHLKFFSVSTLRAIVKQGNFNNIRFKFCGRLPFFWKSMLCLANK
jgi:2-polyprenyl-3-methyl-5-hydroxy-6-metoxy-1,4-benzoquinol methylase